jgi:hypothetical protein
MADVEASAAQARSASPSPPKPRGHCAYAGVRNCGLRAAAERLIWLEEPWLDKLNSIRLSGESYSEAIIRLAAL